MNSPATVNMVFSAFHHLACLNNCSVNGKVEIVLFVSFHRLDISARIIVWIAMSVFLNNPSHGYE